MAFISVCTELHGEKMSKKVITKNRYRTYAISRALDVLHVRGTLGCVDVGKNADASLIDTNEIFTAWRSIKNETLLGKKLLRALGRSTCGSVRESEF